MDKMQRALRDADRMEKEAVAADILEASCDYVAEHRVRERCHLAIDENEDQLKAALMTPPSDLSRPVIDPEWLCRKVLAACGKKEKISAEVPRWWWRLFDGEGPLGSVAFLTATIGMGFVFFQGLKPWQLLWRPRAGVRVQCFHL